MAESNKDKLFYYYNGSDCVQEWWGIGLNSDGENECRLKNSTEVKLESELTYCSQRADVAIESFVNLTDHFTEDDIEVVKQKYDEYQKRWEKYQNPVDKLTYATLKVVLSTLIVKFEPQEVTEAKRAHKRPWWDNDGYSPLQSE